MRLTGDQFKMLARPNPSWLLLVATLGLTAIGIFAIGTVEPGYADKQTTWLVIALVGMAAAMLPHPRTLGLWSYLLLGLGIGLLVFVLLPGVPRSIVPVRNGARCWIDLQVMSVQPSELVKIAFVMAMAWYLRHQSSYRTWRGLLLPFAIMLVPVMLIVKEPDLGTAILFPPALFAMLIAAGARLRHIGIIVAAGMLLLSINIAVIYLMPESMQLLKPHQVNRIKSMVSQVQGDRRYIQTIGYQQHKAMTLIGAGGVAGYGDRASTIIRYNKLPEDHNDMIYVVIVNRWGLLGGMATLGLFMLLIVGLLMVAACSKDPFGRLIAVGFAGLTFTQVTINVGMTIGLLPITGITLPFVSYGGSSLVACFVMVGLAINIASRRTVLVGRPSFEYDKPQRATWLDQQAATSPAPERPV